MALEDVLMGWHDDTPVYAAYRIDYDSTADIRFADGEARFDGPAKSPRPGADGHPVKDGYQRKLVVSTQADRDAAHAVLDGDGVDYTTEDVAPSQAEQDAVEAHRPPTGVAAVDAIKYDKALAGVRGGGIDMTDVLRGTNPSTGETFDLRRFRY